MSCQTFIIGLNPDSDSKAFLDSVKRLDTASLERMVTHDAKELESFITNLKKVKESSSAASRSHIQELQSVQISECFVGQVRAICLLNNGTELRLIKDGLSWKVDLSESTFIKQYNQDSRNLILAELTPREVAIEFARALLEGNAERCQSLGTEQTARLIPIVVEVVSSKLSEMTPEEMLDANAELETMECEVYLDQASCGPRGKNKSLKLLRVNGEWKVDFSKERNSEE